ncbi:endocuticle structural glycoprotein SgAbd-1-like [Chelonus insularis]|uniref:endocuticle structural glycoprotein SgAbd-1-like n=1 Tax=Chelonus insularis TaxID=460826 RepID=UPI00158D9037|nr:endocuticle structural glycoprotein SgAbd-1-like [Chelonus insularis]
MNSTKSIIVLMLLGAVTILGAPQGDLATPATIINESRDGPNPEGSYSYSFETSNGIQAQEQGSVVASQNNKDEGAMSVQGSYQYTAEDGSNIQLSYIADENGFQPKGDHLPVAPEIPPAILKALEWIAAHPEEDNLRK